MNNKPKRYSIKEFKALLKMNGYEYDRASGDHLIYKNKDGKHITITATRLNIMVARRLIKENGLQE